MANAPKVDIRFSNTYKGTSVNGVFQLETDRLGNYVPTTTIKVSGTAEAFQLTGSLPSVITAKAIARFAKDYASSRKDGKVLNYEPDTDYRVIGKPRAVESNAELKRPAMLIYTLKPNTPAVQVGKDYFSK